MKGFRAIRSIISTIVLIVFGIVILAVFGSYTTPELVPFENLKAGAQSDKVYEMKDVLVLYQYGYVEYDDPSDNEYYYLVAYETEEDEAYHLASLQVDRNDGAIYQKLNTYNQSTTTQIGDCYIDMCVRADSVDYLDADIHQFYNEEVEVCKTDYEDVVDSSLAFDYACDSAEAFPEFVENEKQAHKVGTIMGCVFLGLGLFIAAIFIIGLLKKKKTPAAANSGNGQVFYTPNTAQPQDVYYNPNQEQNNSYGSQVEITGNNYSQNFENPADHQPETGSDRTENQQ